MPVTVELDEADAVRLTEQVLEPDPPDEVRFRVEGVLRPTEALLDAFAGQSLRPARIGVEIDEAPSVEVNLDEATLRLETVDVGIERPDVEDPPEVEDLPDAGDIPGTDDVADAVERPSTDYFTDTVGRPATDDVPGTDAIGSSSAEGSGSGEARPGALAFTVEGTIRDVPDETLQPMTEGAPTVSSITFEVENTARSDGGPGDGGRDVVFEFRLVGFHVSIRRDGTIEIGVRSDEQGVSLP